MKINNCQAYDGGNNFYAMNVVDTESDTKSIVFIKGGNY